MEIHEDTKDGATVMALSGRLDSNTASDLEAVLPPRISECSAMIVDLADVSYVSSAGLRVLLKGAKIAKSSGNKLVLSGLDPSVREVFDISGFSAIFNIEPDVGAALASVA